MRPGWLVPAYPDRLLGRGVTPILLTRAPAGPSVGAEPGGSCGPDGADAVVATIIHPLALYLACALGALGVALALPRPRISPAIFGGIIAAAAGGLVIVLLGIAGGLDALPNWAFYVFSAMALGGGLRMITHPRPVYSALYFILTIVASAGLLLILSAEFMAFALIIIYAGAILITYLFVIMLATQAPAEGDLEHLAEYDTQAREPWAMSAAGFVLLGVLTTMLFRGAGELPQPTAPDDVAVLAQLPQKVERELRLVTIDGPDGEPVALLGKDETLERATDADGEVLGRLRYEDRTVFVTGDEARAIELPAEMRSNNVEQVGINLLRDHPMTIEIAGVLLLMAMLGATVLARKQVELEEALKARQAKRLHDAKTEREGLA